MQHKIVYYSVPDGNKNMNDVMIMPGSLIYANFTPYELIRRTGPSGKLLVPYFDKPATFLYVSHENPHLEMVFMLDVDEFLDCSDDIDKILTSHKEYENVDELRVPRRVVQYTYKHTYFHMYTYIYSFIHTYIHTYIHIYRYICTDRQMYIHILTHDTYIHTYTHRYLPL